MGRNLSVSLVEDTCRLLPPPRTPFRLQSNRRRGPGPPSSRPTSICPPGRRLSGFRGGLPALRARKGGGGGHGGLRYLRPFFSPPARLSSWV